MENVSKLTCFVMANMIVEQMILLMKMVVLQKPRSKSDLLVAELRTRGGLKSRPLTTLMEEYVMMDSTLKRPM